MVRLESICDLIVGERIDIGRHFEKTASRAHRFMTDIIQNAIDIGDNEFAHDDRRAVELLIRRIANGTRCHGITVDVLDEPRLW